MFVLDVGPESGQNGSGIRPLLGSSFPGIRLRTLPGSGARVGCGATLVVVLPPRVDLRLRFSQRQALIHKH